MFSKQPALNFSITHSQHAIIPGTLTRMPFFLFFCVFCLQQQGVFLSSPFFHLHKSLISRIFFFVTFKRILLLVWLRINLTGILLLSVSNDSTLKCKQVDNNLLSNNNTGCKVSTEYNESVHTHTHKPTY